MASTPQGVEPIRPEPLEPPPCPAAAVILPEDSGQVSFPAALGLRPALDKQQPVSLWSRTPLQSRHTASYLPKHLPPFIPKSPQSERRGGQVCQSCQHSGGEEGGRQVQDNTGQIPVLTLSPKMYTMYVKHQEGQMDGSADKAKPGAHMAGEN